MTWCSRSIAPAGTLLLLAITGAPDIRSNRIAAIGTKTGAKTHTLTEGQLPSHRHEGIFVDAVQLRWEVQGQSGSNMAILRPGTATNPVRTGFAGGGQPHSIVQPSFVCRYVIRAA
ncbi:putative antireceptor [Microcella alkaliphila]|uniref:Putative antireceptor n=1 Tax=Microcella alkaliphila TaxID=279828 RepID=A0A0U5CG10_9MICO|nr:putative antireceptor [Microcella alkaliphila]